MRLPRRAVPALLALAIGIPFAVLLADRVMGLPFGIMTLLWSAGLFGAFCAAVYLAASRG